MSGKGWIGVDLDGTLAHYETWTGPCDIGAPIKAMQERVITWLIEGKNVRIVTARAYNNDGNAIPAVVAAIEHWCKTHLGQALPVTNRKDFAMIVLWDDRCVTVELNTGRVLTVKTGSPEVDGENIASQLREWATHVLDGSAIYCQAPVALLKDAANLLDILEAPGETNGTEQASVDQGLATASVGLATADGLRNKPEF